MSPAFYFIHCRPLGTSSQARSNSKRLRRRQTAIPSLQQQQYRFCHEHIVAVYRGSELLDISKPS